MAATGVLPSRAPAATGHPQSKVTPPTKPLPQSLIDGARVVEKQTFDFNRHCNFQMPSNILTMEDIGYTGMGISNTAVSEPFPLFTEEAIKQMRGEIFSKHVLDNFQCATKMATNMIRGYGSENAPFIHSAWNNPEVLEALSKVAGIDVVTAVDVEIGHCNVSAGEEGGLLARPVLTAQDQDVSAFGWHFDAYPFVCVIMLSDCSGMVGGETVIRCANGEQIKARGPTMGTAVVMQGRYIEHQALKAFGGRERISIVTCLRARSPYVADECNPRCLLGITQMTPMFHQYSTYRLEHIKQRMSDKIDELLQRREEGQEFDIGKMRKFLANEKAYLEDMLAEIQLYPD